MNYSNLDSLMTIEKNELLNKLKETYLSYKLSKNQAIAARGIEVLVAIIFIFSGIEWYYILVYIFVIIYGIYRVMKPNEEDQIYFKKFELLADEFENFKRFKRNQIDVDIKAEKLHKIEKSIEKCLPLLIQVIGIGKVYKICAFIPVVNILIDETTLYRDPKSGPLNILLYGNLVYPSLEDFESSKIKEI